MTWWRTESPLFQRLTVVDDVATVVGSAPDDPPLIDAPAAGGHGAAATAVRDGPPREADFAA